MTLYKTEILIELSFLDFVQVLSCGLGGEWTKPPNCRFVDCGSPARPDRGSSKLLNDSTTVGSVVKYQCDEDYWLVGPAELSCTKEGKWSGDPPACECMYFSLDKDCVFGGS